MTRYQHEFGSTELSTVYSAHVKHDTVISIVYRHTTAHRALPRCMEGWMLRPASSVVAAAEATSSELSRERLRWATRVLNVLLRSDVNERANAMPSSRPPARSYAYAARRRGSSASTSCMFFGSPSTQDVRTQEPVRQFNRIHHHAPPSPPHPVTCPNAPVAALDAPSINAPSHDDQTATHVSVLERAASVAVIPSSPAPALWP